MKYIKNNTDNNIVIRDFVDGKEVILIFPKSTVTAISEELEEAFAEVCDEYETLFTNGTLTYTTRPSEKYKDDFSRMLRGYALTESVLKVSLDPSLADETVVLNFSIDGGAFTTSTATVPDNGVIVFEFTDPITDHIDFRITNDYTVDFPFMYSDRIKEFIK